MNHSSDIHLYHGAICTASQRVRLLLAELNLPYTCHLIDMLKQEHITEAYLAINPKGLLPVLLDGENLITDSNDILEYIDEKYAEKVYTPSDIQKASTHKQLMLQSSQLLSNAKYFYFEYLFKPFVRKSPEEMNEFKKLQKDENIITFHEKLSINGRFDDEQLLAAYKEIESILVEVDALLSQSEYLLGNTLYLADFSLLPLITWLDFLGYPLAQHKGILRWMKQMKLRSSYRTAISNYVSVKVSIFLRAYSAIRTIKGDSLKQLLSKSMRPA